MTTPRALTADALRARLGKGARSDAPTAPAEDLARARHGMAFFARHLNALPDEALANPSRISGWTRAHVVACVSIAARAQALALAELRGQLLDDDFAWDPDIILTATLPPRALRHLFNHAHVHVNVEWRDLASGDWLHSVALPPNVTIAVRDLPIRQAALLWWGAVALRAGAAATDVPALIGPPSGPFKTMAPLGP